MDNNKKCDCIIEQFATDHKTKGYHVHHNPEEFKAFWDTVAITKVYLTEAYKKQLQDEFQYSY